MPGAYPRTSTIALTNLPLPCVVALADRGWVGVCRADPALAKGLNTHAGELANGDIAAAHASTGPRRTSTRWWRPPDARHTSHTPNETMG
jgi:alanine dehydrogenase